MKKLAAFWLLTLSWSGIAHATDCIATYDENQGRVHIPCVSVPESGTDELLYDVFLNQEPESATALRFSLEADTMQSFPRTGDETCVARYFSGTVHLPCVSVLDTYGYTQNYEVELLHDLAGNGLFFEVDFALQKKKQTVPDDSRDTSGTQYRSYLTTGQYLSPGEFLVSPNGYALAILQGDGNFVVYKGSGPEDIQNLLWATWKTAGIGNYFSIMQGDGNFVVYKGRGPSDNQGYLWGTQAIASGGDFFALLRDDGDFVVRKGTSPDDSPDFGYALKFDGANDYIALPTKPVPTTTGTIEHWVKSDGGVTEVLVYIGDDSGDNPYDGFGNGVDKAVNTSFVEIHTGIREGGKAHFHFHQIGNKYGTNLVGTSTITDGRWHHIAATYAYNGMVKLYVDGQLEAQKNAASRGYGTRAGKLAYIGRPIASTRYFGGSLDEVRIWNSVRTQEEIQAWMNKPLAGGESNLVAYYPFELSSRTTANDATGGDDGELKNDPQRVMSGAGSLWTTDLHRLSADPFGKYLEYTEDAREPGLFNVPDSPSVRSQIKYKDWDGNNMIAQAKGGSFIVTRENQWEPAKEVAALQMRDGSSGDKIEVSIVLKGDTCENEIATVNHAFCVKPAAQPSTGTDYVGLQYSLIYQSWDAGNYVAFSFAGKGLPESAQVLKILYRTYWPMFNVHVGYQIRRPSGAAAGDILRTMRDWREDPGKVENFKLNKNEEFTRSLWIYIPEDKTIRAADNMDLCFTPDGNRHLVLWPCSGLPEQRWDIARQDNTVRQYHNSGMCLVAAYTENNNPAGYEVYVTDCTSGRAGFSTIQAAEDVEEAAAYLEKKKLDAASSSPEEMARKIVEESNLPNDELEYILWIARNVYPDVANADNEMAAAKAVAKHLLEIRKKTTKYGEVELSIFSLSTKLRMAGFGAQMAADLIADKQLCENLATDEQKLKCDTSDFLIKALNFGGYSAIEIVTYASKLKKIAFSTVVSHLADELGIPPEAIDWIVDLF